MILDAHSHILPMLDDGAGSVRESELLLKQINKQGADAVIATPHYYNGKYDFADYYRKASNAYLRAQRYSAVKDLFLGFEVKYFSGITDFAHLKELTLGGSGYLLLELDWGGITDKAVAEIAAMYDKTGIMPILAHIERYSFYTNYSKALKLVEDGKALAQLNADSVLFGVNKGEAVRLAKNGYYSLLGSDTHSLLGRPPHIAEFFAAAPQIIGQRKIEDIMSFSKKLYNDMKQNEGVF